MPVYRTLHRLCSSGWPGQCQASVPLGRLSSSRVRRASLLLPHAHSTHVSPQIAFVDDQQRSRQVNNRRSQRKGSKRRNAAGAPSLAPAQLTAQIRACNSTAQLFELYRCYGPTFNHIHACAALHRLAEVAPASATDPSLTASAAAHCNGVDTPSRSARLLSTSQPPAVLTGRLTVRQGQEEEALAIPDPGQPLSAEYPGEDLMDRRNSNYAASTSASNSTSARTSPSPSSPNHQDPRKQQLQPLSQTQQQQTLQRAQLQSRMSGGGGEPAGAGLLPAAMARRAPPPPPKQVVRMVSGLAAVLSFQCHELDGRGLATAANALSRLGYNDAALLEQLEQRCLVLVAQQEQQQQQQQGQQHTTAAMPPPQTSRWRQQQRQQEFGVAQEQAEGCLEGSGVGLEPNTRQQQQGLGRDGPRKGPSSVLMAIAQQSGEQGTGAMAGERGARGEAQGPGISNDNEHMASPAVAAAGADDSCRTTLSPSSAGGPIPQHPSAAGPQGGKSNGHNAALPQQAYPALTAADLHVLVTALGSLRFRPSQAWLAAVEATTADHLSAYAARHGQLPALLRALGDMGLRPKAAWLKAACAAARPRLHTYSARQLLTLVSGLGALGHSPDAEWTAELMTAIEEHLPSYGAWELVGLVGGLAALRCRPSEGWMECFYGSVLATVGAAGGMTGSQAASLLSSLSQLDCRPASDWLNTLLLGTRRSLVDASSQQLTDLLTSLARLRFRPPEPWLQQYFAASFQRLPFHTPQQCCAVAASVVLLGRKPQQLWLEELGRQLGGKLALMQGGQQARALAALADLGYVPAAGWLAGYEQHSNAQLAGCSVEELCTALRALVKLGFKPNASWLYSFIMTAYSKLDAFDAAQLALVFDCLPSLTPHGSWVDEIIQICAAESNMRAQAAAQAAAQERQAAAAAESGATESVAVVNEPEAQVAPVAAAAVSGRQQLALHPHVDLPPGQSAAVQEQQPQQVLAPEQQQVVAEVLATAALETRPDKDYGAEGVEAAALAVEAGTAPQAAASVVLATVGAVPLDATGPEQRAGAGGGDGTIRAAPLVAVAAVEAAADAVEPPSRFAVIEAFRGAGADSEVVELSAAAAAPGQPSTTDAVVGQQLPSGAACGSDTPLAARPMVPGFDARVAGAVVMGASADEGTLASSTCSASGDEAAAGAATAAAAAEPQFEPGCTIEIPTELVPVNGGVVSMGAPCGGGAAAAAGGSVADGVGLLVNGGPVVYGSDGGDASDAIITVLPPVAVVTAVSGLAAPGPSSNGAKPASRTAARGGGGSGDGGDSGRPGSGGGGGGAGGDGSGGDVNGAANATSGVAGANGGSNGAGRVGQLVVLPRPTRARVPAAAVLAASTPAAAAVDVDPAADPAAAGSGRSSVSAVTLQPKPRPLAGGLAAAAPPASAGTVTAGSGSGSSGTLPLAAGGSQLQDSMQTGTPPVPVSTSAGTAASAAAAAAANTPLLPYSTASAAAKSPLASAETSTAAAPAAAASAAAGAGSDAAAPAPAALSDDGRVQYLDSASLVRLIGAPDGPPGPDFSNCQRRSRRAAGGGPYGALFQLGRVWTNELAGQGGGAGGAAGAGPGQPVPSPSG